MADETHKPPDPKTPPVTSTSDDKTTDKIIISKKVFDDFASI